MKQYIRIISATFLISILFSSCIIKGNFKGLYGYYKKTKTENPNLLYKVNEKDSTSDCNVVNLRPKILVLNGKTLKKCLDNNQKSLIYLWAPKCSSQICFPLEIVQTACNSKKIELYVVAEYFDSEKMNVLYKTNRLIFGIDTEYYKTNLTTRYVKNFLTDIDAHIDLPNLKNRYLYFENGKFIKSYQSVYDIEK